MAIANILRDEQARDLINILKLNNESLVRKREVEVGIEGECNNTVNELIDVKCPNCNYEFTENINLDCNGNVDSYGQDEVEIEVINEDIVNVIVSAWEQNKEKILG
jgi:hypothetical protein